MSQWFIIQNYWDWIEKIMPLLSFPTTRMLASIFQEFCIILFFMLFVRSYTASKKYQLSKIFFFKFTASYFCCLQEPTENHKSDGQVPNYRPYFLESCGSEILLWRCYATKEASRYRNKVTKIILAETNAETFNTFKGYAISFNHMV